MSSDEDWSDVEEDMTVSELFSSASDKTWMNIAKTGVGGWLLALAASIITGMQSIFELLFLPFEKGIDIVDASVTAFITGPMQLITGGELLPQDVQPAIEVTARAIESNFGFTALWITQIVVYVSLIGVAAYLAIQITSNFAPGLLSDNVLWTFFFGTPEEEAEED